MPQAPPPTDPELVALVRRGDDRALGVLYDRYADRLYSLAVAIVSDPADAEDAVADAFLRLWQTAEYDADRGSVGAYLVTVVRSRALDRLKAARRRGAREERGAAGNASGVAVPLSALHPAPDRAAELNETRTLLRAALEQVSEAQRAVIDLAYFQGMTHSEIADHLSEPLGTVKTRLRDGMRRLRQLVPRTARSS